jgi:hypothetical protein
MSLSIELVGAQPHEQHPSIALYAFDIRGRVAGKLAVADKGELDIEPHRLPPIVALGPDVADPASLDPAGLMTLRVSDQVDAWRETNAILVPGPWWRRWPGFQTCLTGTAERCFPFGLNVGDFRNIALGRPSIFERCAPLCNAVVEIWESTTCCWPFPIWEVPRVISGLRQFLADNPVMFPQPPRPDPGPPDRVLAASVDQALARSAPSRLFVPSTDLALHLTTLQSLESSEALQYIEANPVLWRFVCETSSAMLTETPVTPDGSFSYCYWRYPFFLINCRSSYFYKVKQQINGAWTYVYDGAAANQYFTADQAANLYSWTGVTCYQQPPLPGTDFVAFQAIGATDTSQLNSHWAAPSVIGGVNVDQTQTAEYTLASPPTDAGLVLADGAPWGGTLPFLLAFDPGLQALGAVYYRMSVVQADGGAPMAGATVQVIKNPVAWSQFQIVGGALTEPVIPLGPNIVADVDGNPIDGLYTIPYPPTSPDTTWQSNQYHQHLDTTTLPNALGATPGVGNGRYLVILEIFDAAANRLIPLSASSVGPTDTSTGFNYYRLFTPPGPGAVTAEVPFGALTHLIWVDNRDVVGSIDYFNSTSGTQECQFINVSDGSALFRVGYRAYHNVMCDPGPSPIPTFTFMASYEVSWEEGLSGPSGVLDEGGDINQPNPPFPTCPALAPDVTTPGTSFSTLLGGETACSFAITLTITAKHTNGSGPVFYPVSIPAAVALSIGELCIPTESRLRALEPVQ